MGPPNVEKAVFLYYEKTEMSNADIMSLFNVSKSKANDLKKAVLTEMAKEQVRCWAPYHINTKVAFKVWGIDIDEFEKRLKKLRTLRGGA